MKILVMGCGRIGAEVSTLLWKQGNQVTVLEKEPEGFARLPQEMQSENTTLPVSYTPLTLPTILLL